MKLTAMKKRMIGGLLAGTMLVVGGIGYAATEETAQNGAPPARMGARDGMQRRQPPQMDPSVMAKRLSENFGVDEQQVLTALNENRDFRDIGSAAMIAKLSGKSFQDVLAMKTDSNHWPEIEKSLGISRDQIRAEMDAQMAGRLAVDGAVSQEKAAALLKAGYQPRDIAMAAIIAKESGKDIQKVLDQKTINNRWMDVAKKLNVDESKLRPAHNRGDHDFDGPRGGHRGFGNGDCPADGPQGNPPDRQDQ